MEEQAKEILKKYNQEHIIKWMDKQEDSVKQKIINQVLEIDLEELKELYNKVKRGIVKKDFKVTPIHAIEKDGLSENEKQKYLKIGENILRNNKYAVLTLAGGQGTRLRTYWTKRKL